MRHIVQVKTKSDITNYLDNFLFLALTILRYNYLLNQFLVICEEIGFPIALDKTQWASEVIVFLGILLDGRRRYLSIPIEKQHKAIILLQTMIDKSKVTVKDLQILCGYLNFLGKAIVPGRTFTRHMYAKYQGIVRVHATNDEMVMKVGLQLKAHHHVQLDGEFKKDCQVWLQFLQDTNLAYVVNRPMVDFAPKVNSQRIFFYSDASTAKTLGFGCILYDSWIFAKWELGYIAKFNPSIEYLELYALTAGLLTWEDDPTLNDCRVTIFCDNQAVVGMINKLSSSCPNSMFLLRLIVLNGLRHNRKVFAAYVDTKSNYLADALSRLDL